MATETTRQRRPGDGPPLGTVFRWMLREEWRLHAHMFGGRRFAGFPVFVAVLAGATAEFLTFAGTDFGAVIAGFHALVFAFGLHTGSIGFVGRDASRNVVPTGTLLVFSARTLPLSQRQLIAVFLLKDAVFYVFLFLLPLTLGFAPSVLSGSLSVVDLPVLWVSIGATFLLGTATTFAAIALSTRGYSGWIGMLALAAAAGLLWVSADLVQFTPYALYADRTPLALLGTAVGLVVLVGGGLAAYDPTYERPARSTRNGFRRWHDRLPFGDGLLTKTLLDVSRSSGGLFKLFFSGGILFVVSAYLISFAGDLTGVPPSTGVSFGAILGLTAFTTYNWLTSTDSPEDYLPYPVDVPDVFRAKFRAFLLMGPPVGLAYFGVAVVWQLTWGSGAIRPLETVAGLALLLGLELYLFGVTVYLTGFSPNEFLFDSLLFAVFFVAVAAVTAPILIVAFVGSALAGTPGGAIPAAYLVGVGGASVTLGAAGVVLYRRAVPKWTGIHRRGGG
jgi:hypothetical protein